VSFSQDPNPGKGARPDRCEPQTPTLRRKREKGTANQSLSLQLLMAGAARRGREPSGRPTLAAASSQGRSFCLKPNPRTDHLLGSNWADGKARWSQSTLEEAFSEAGCVSYGREH
jgi:hypothetical protein